MNILVKFGIGCIVFGLLFLLITIPSYTNPDEFIVSVVPCVDAVGNEIMGSSCRTTTTQTDQWAMFLGIGIGGIIGGFISLLFGIYLTEEDR